MRARAEVTKQTLLINAGSTVVKRALTLGLALWMIPYLVRHLTEEEYALYPMLFGVLSLPPLVSAAIASGLGRYLTEAYANDDDRRITQITSTITPILFGIAGIMLALGLLFAWKIQPILGIGPGQVRTARLMFLFLFVPIIPRVVLGPYVLGFFIRQKLVQRDLVGIFADALRVALIVYLLTEYEPWVAWVGVAHMVSGLAELAAVLAISRRFVPALRFKASEIRRDLVGPVFRFGWWTIVGQASTLIREMLEPIILRHLASAGDVVTLNIGSTVERQLRRTVTSGTDVAKPAATTLVATEQEARLRRAWLRMSRYGLWVTFAAAIPFIVFRHEVFLVWMGDDVRKYPGVPLVMALLLARFLAIFPESSVHMLAVARAEMRSATWRTLTIDLSTIGLTLLLVGKYDMGATGLAIAALSISLVAHPLLMWSLGLQLTGTKASDWLRISVLHGILPGILATPSWLAMHHFVRPDTLLELGLCASIGWVVYGLTLYLTLRPEERDDLRHVQARIIKRLALRAEEPAAGSSNVDADAAHFGWRRTKRRAGTDADDDRSGRSS